MSADKFALQAWHNTEAHLAGAAAANPSKIPLLVVHAAYYEMYHAARAVLLRTGGSAPKKHSSVIGQFGSLVKDRGDPFRQVGHDLNEAESLRIDADYEDAAAISAQDARDALTRAEAFLDLCSREFAFPRMQSSTNG